MDEGNGYGNCDEVEWDTGEDKCEGCKGCDAPSDEKKQHMLMPVCNAAENMRTQPVRIRVTDLVRLQALQERPDETPGGVIHRVLDEHGTSRHDGGEFDSEEDTIMKYEGVITTQTEKIRTLRREVQEQKGIIDVITSPGDKKGKNVSDTRKEYEDKLAEAIGYKEDALKILDDATVNFQSMLNDRNVRIMQLENELEEIAAVETDTVSAGPGTTININVFRGNPAGGV